nr:reverse transcriptase domain-containing protein [Tanacetum cinerariifolium]
MIQLFPLLLLPSLFGDSDFLLFEEAGAFLSLEDDPDSPKINPFYYDPEGDILLLEAILNSEPSPPPPNQEQNLPSFKEELKAYEAQTIKSSVDEPPEPGTLCTQKDGFTVVENEEKELIPTRLVIEWRVCIDYRKLNKATRKDHFPLPFMDRILERLAGNEYYCFLDGFFGYFQIPIDPRDQEKTTFTCPYGTFAYRRMPFGLCNALGTFQRCMLAIFHGMVEKTMEVSMDDFSEQDKVADDDTVELKRCLEIVLEDDDDVAIEATPLSSKSPTIVDYKIYREGNKSYLKIIRADGNSQNYLTFGTMFKNFNREDLEVLRSIVKERFMKTNPVDNMENLLFQILKTMFEPHVEEIIWKYQQGAVKFNNWKLFDSFNATYVHLVLLVYEVAAVFNKVNAAKSRVTTVVRVSTTGWIKRLEEQDMRVNEIY